MPHHIHSAPQCGFWAGHDPACANFGPEQDCILIEAGMNKGSYMCIHRRAGLNIVLPAAQAVAGEPAPVIDDKHPQLANLPDGAVVSVIAGSGMASVRAPGYKPGEENFGKLLPDYLAIEYGSIYFELRLGRQ